MVAAGVDLVQVVEQAATLRHHLQKATTRVVVLLVSLEVFGEVGDALRQDRDLNLGRAGVAGGAGVIGDDLVLAFSSNRHRSSPLVAYRAFALLEAGLESPDQAIR